MGTRRRPLVLRLRKRRTEHQADRQSGRDHGRGPFQSLCAHRHDGPGNVDMLTWVTMTDEGPEIAGIALKGIFDRKGLDPAMFDAYDRTPDPNATGH